MSTVLWPNGTANIPRVTSEFGPRVAPVTGASTFHRGIDLSGFPVNRSPVDGTVTFAGYSGSAGNMILISGTNGDTFMLAHNARLLVTQGQRVLAGQDVGVQGDTGVAAGVHCHFEIHPGGGPAVNPRDYMAARITQAGTITPMEGHPKMFSLIPVAASNLGLVQSLVTGNYVGIANGYHKDLLRRVLRNDYNDPMLFEELDIVKGYLVVINPPSPQIDVPALVAKVAAANDADQGAILTAIGKLGAVGGDPDAIARQVESILSDNFAALPAAVADEQSTRLQS